MKNLINYCFYLLTLTFAALVSPLCALSLDSGSKIACPKLALAGDYQLELEDPNHRHVHFLRPIYAFWVQSWCDQFPDFWNFVEVKKDLIKVDYPAIYDLSTHMIWLDDDEHRSLYQATFYAGQQGKIGIQTPVNGSLPNGKWMFVLIDDAFYVALERKFQFHHSSLSGGQPVDSAGTFTIKDGHLAKISLVSGHYRPKVVHGKRCLESLKALNIDVAGLLITYCVVQDDMVIKKRVTVEEFLSSASDAADPSLSKFFVPLDNLEMLAVEKAELFLTPVGILWIGSTKLSESDALCQGYGPFLLRASVKIREGKITNIVFNTPIEQPGEVEKMQLMVNSLTDQGIDIEGIRFRIIRNFEKEVVGYRELSPAALKAPEDVVRDRTSPELARKFGKQAPVIAQLFRNSHSAFKVVVVERHAFNAHFCAKGGKMLVDNVAAR